VPIRLLPARWVTTWRLLSQPRGRIQSDERVPTLDAALSALPDGVEIGIHVKDRSALGATLDVVERCAAAERTWLWLEWPQDARTARERLPGVRVTLLNDWRRGRSMLHYLEAA